MLELNDGGVMDKEIFTHTLQALYQDLERVEQKRRRQDSAPRRQGKNRPAQIGGEYDQVAS